MESKSGSWLRRPLGRLVQAAALMLAVMLAVWITELDGAASGTTSNTAIASQSSSSTGSQEKDKGPENRDKGMRVIKTVDSVKVKGIAKTEDGKPVVGALVGLLLPGSKEATKESLVCWGRTNPEGKFELNKPVRLGEYTLKVSASGYEPYTKEINIKEGKEVEIEIELRESKNK